MSAGGAEEPGMSPRYSLAGPRFAFRAVGKSTLHKSLCWLILSPFSAATADADPEKVEAVQQPIQEAIDNLAKLVKVLLLPLLRLRLRPSA